MRIAVAGSGHLAAHLMHALLKSSHTIVALVQNGRATKGFQRSMMLTASRAFPLEFSVMGIAARNRIPIVWIDRMTDEELVPLRLFEPDLLLVGGFSIILKRPILDLPHIGCLNVHTSLLPRHRGPNPFAAVILSNDTHSGVTFHIIDEGIDTGDIVKQISFPIGARDTSLDVYEKGCQVTHDNIICVLDQIEQEGLSGVSQNQTIASYDRKLTPDDYQIDWTQSAADIDRLIRAVRPFGYPTFQWRGKPIFVTITEPCFDGIDAPPGVIVRTTPHVRVATGAGELLVLSAYAARPIPWTWPSPWNRPKPGEHLE